MRRALESQPQPVLQESLRLLDEWATRPVSHWTRSFEASDVDAMSQREATEFLLAAMVAHDEPLDLWIVREGVETAWTMAPRDVRVNEMQSIRARQAMERRALAWLLRDRLPAFAFRTLTSESPTLRRIS